MRLIDADALVTEYYKNPSYKNLCTAINTAPTIDAVQVVRCKDCRWGRAVCGNIECSVVPPEYHGYEWFCPNGERKHER